MQVTGMEIKKYFEIKNKRFFAVVLTLAALVIFFRPGGLALNQSITLACALFCVLGWASGFLSRPVLSVFLLLAFSIVGGTGLERVFTFPLSPNFITIAASFLLSQGVVKSKAADRAAELVLQRWCRSSRGLVAAFCVLNVILTLLIPQPIPRILLLSSVAAAFVEKRRLADQEKRVVLFSVFVSATATAMIIRNGDVVLNNTALVVAGAQVDQTQWLLYMTAPSVAASILLLLLFLWVFRRDLTTVFAPPSEPETTGYRSFQAESETSAGQARQTKLALAVMAVVIALWMTEQWHGLSGAWVSVLGVLAMFIMGILRLADLKAVNLEILLFLTAAFSIGSVLVDSGTASVLMDAALGGYRPEGFWQVMTVSVLLVMVIHMAVGSAVTALSVAVPVVAAVTGDGMSAEMLALTSLVLVTVHYILPFHQLTIMVGTRYFQNRDVLRFSLPLTAAVILLMLLVYLPWWKLTGLW